jgi:hypothetical protein
MGGRVSERATQHGDGEIGMCHVCGDTFATQEELSKHLIDAHEGLGTADGPARTTRPETPPAGD